MNHKDKFENAIRFITSNGYDIKVENNKFCMSKNGYTNRAETEDKVIELAKNMKIFNK